VATRWRRGLTLGPGRLGDLRAFLITALGSAVARGERRPAISPSMRRSAPAAPRSISSTLVEHAGPFGAGHAEPVFALPAHRVAYADVVGNGHLRVTLAADNGASVRAIAFRAAGSGSRSPRSRARRGAALHVAGTLSVDQYQGAAAAELPYPRCPHSLGERRTQAAAYANFGRDLPIGRGAMTMAKTGPA